MDLENAAGAEEIERAKKKLEEEHNETLKKFALELSKLKYQIMDLLDSVLDTEYAD